MKSAVPLLAAVLLTAHVALGAHEIVAVSQTYDEAVHLASGYSFWKSGKLTIDATMNAPLPALLASFPLLFLHPDAFLEAGPYRDKAEYIYGDLFLYHNRVPAETLLGAARLFLFLLLSPLLGWFVFRWGRELGGDPGGLAALFLYAFNPAILANAPLVATDFSATFFDFLSLYALSAAMKRDRGRAPLFLLTGALFGLAMASKHSSVLLLALMPFSAAFGAYASGRAFLSKRLLPDGLMALTGALAAVALAYGPGQIPLWWRGLSATLAIVNGNASRIAYLLGETTGGGWWYYFPLAFLMKTPLPLLILAGAALLGVSEEKNDRAGQSELLAFVFAPVALWMAAACFSHFQIGVRHILPVYPFCCVIGGVAVARLWRAGPGWRRRCAVLLLGWYAAGTLAAHPHELAYFNEAAGGPMAGYKLLNDSNQDWGQELKSLGRLVRDEGTPPIYLSYFGTADPHLYGIRYVPILYFSDMPRPGDPVEPFRSPRILFAISGTNRGGGYSSNRRIWDWLGDYRPYKVLGYSLFVYDFTGRPEALMRLARILAANGKMEPALALARWIQRAPGS